MSTLADLVTAKPATGAGRLIPWAGTTGDWRFAVEIAAVDPTVSAWSVAEWGPDDDSGDAEWGDEDLGYDWVDITGDVRGLEWRRGADEPYGRTRTGIATVELDNRTNRYSPWADDPVGSFVSTQRVLGAGSVIRWGYHRLSSPSADPTRWRPQFCGIVEHWDTETAGVDASRRTLIPLVETAAFLAGVDEPERTPVGADDNIAGRIPTLIADDETGWPFGDFHFDMFNWPFPLETLQPTAMAGNRIAELYLTAESVSDDRPLEFCTDRQGRALLRAVATAQHPTWDQRGALTFNGGLPAFAPGKALTLEQQALFDLVPDAPTGTGLWIPMVCQYPADALRHQDSRDAIVNWTSIAAAGGTAQVFEDAESRQMHGRRTFQRHDLICQPSSPTPTLQGQRIVGERAQARHVVQPFTVRATDGTGNFDVVTITDSQEAAVVFGHSPSSALLCRVRAIRHRILPHHGHAGHRHDAEFELDVLTEIEAA